MELFSTTKIYPNRGLQVTNYFDDSFFVGCYCVIFPDDKKSILCHLHKPKKDRGSVEYSSKYEKEYALESSVRRSKTMVLDYALANHFDYFVTLTIDPSKHDPHDHESTKLALSRFLDSLRKKDSSLKYIVVPELHKSGAIHFHGLFATSSLSLSPALNPKTNKKIYKNIKIAETPLKQEKHSQERNQNYPQRIKVKNNPQESNNFSQPLIEGSPETPQNQSKTRKVPVYNIGNYELGWSTAIPIDDSPATAFYLTKYLKKDMLENTVLNKKRYWCSRNLSLPIVFKNIAKKPNNFRNCEKSVFRGQYYTKVTENINVDINTIDNQNQISYDEYTTII